MIYHSMLPEELSERIESLQKKALRIIYGFGHNYESLLSMSGNQTMKDRRINACKKFATGLSKSERYKYLLPLNTREGMGTRRGKKFCEEFSRTNRLYNSPLFFMRRLLNELYEEENEDEETLADLFYD